MDDLNPKIVVFVATADNEKRNDLQMLLMTVLQDVLVFPIADSADYEKRIQKDKPRLVVADEDFLKGNSVLKNAMTAPDQVYVSFIILGTPEDAKAHEYLDELMIGKIQYLGASPSDEEWKNSLKKAFNFSLESQTSSFHMKRLKTGEHLMKVGDPANHVYILKRGKLQAYWIGDNEEEMILGAIEPGEFVGEMAYFNSEPRSANVIALTDAELVEIPIHAFQRVLYQRPAWSMKLIDTLSKRLKKFNVK